MQPGAPWSIDSGRAPDRPPGLCPATSAPRHLERGTRAWAVAGALGGHSGLAPALLERVGGRPQAQDFPAAQALVPLVEHGELESREACVTRRGTRHQESLRSSQEPGPVAAGLGPERGEAGGHSASLSPALAPGVRPRPGRAEQLGPQRLVRWRLPRSHPHWLCDVSTRSPCPLAPPLGIRHAEEEEARCHLWSTEPMGHQLTHPHGPTGDGRASAKACLRPTVRPGHTCPASTCPSPRANPAGHSTGLGAPLTCPGVRARTGLTAVAHTVPS